MISLVKLSDRLSSLSSSNKVGTLLFPDPFLPGGWEGNGYISHKCGCSVLRLLWSSPSGTIILPSARVISVEECHCHCYCLTPSRHLHVYVLSPVPLSALICALGSLKDFMSARKIPRALSDRLSVVSSGLATRFVLMT